MLSVSAKKSMIPYIIKDETDSPG